MFSRKRHWISWTCFRPDLTRPDLDLGAQFSYPKPRPTPLRPDLTLESAVAPCWALFISCPPLHSRDAPECVLSRVCGLEPLHHFTSPHDT